MRTVEERYFCDRCGNEINSAPFNFLAGRFKCTMSVTEYEQVKYGYLPDDKVPLPDDKFIVLDGIFGYASRNIRKIHFCSKCTLKYKEFMKNV